MSAAVEGPPRLLFVDDERLILDGIKRHLCFDYELETAMSGAEALEILRARPGFAVMVTDMRMPEMDGAELLHRARDVAPDTVRILLTGQADMQQAIRATNSGNLFRFLTKPCPADQLERTVAEAVEQHRLVCAERELLSQTLAGSVRTLSEVLSMANPVAFGRATLVQNRTLQLLDTLGEIERWPIEVAAMLAELPVITLPPDTFERYFHGRPLCDADQAMVRRLPETGVRMIELIPRLERVREILLHRPLRFDGAGSPAGAPRGSALPLGARVIKLAFDLAVLETRGTSIAAACDALEEDAAAYDPGLFCSLRDLLAQQKGARKIRRLQVDELEVGMVLAADVLASSGALVVGGGTGISMGLLQRMKNFARGHGLVQPLEVHA